VVTVATKDLGCLDLFRVSKHRVALARGTWLGRKTLVAYRRRLAGNLQGVGGW
jgi:hypothetical protein